jgi:class 3 adenylate cyclase
MKDRAIMNATTNFTDKTLLYGTRPQRFIREFITHSGIFWLFDAVTNIGSNGLSAYLVYLPQWVMFIAALVQSWIISQDTRRFRWWYVFIAPALYTVVDIGIEGWSSYITEGYHLFYWVWAACMGVAYGLNPVVATLSVFLRALLLAILLPALYFFAEIDGGLVIDSSAALRTYWLADSAHYFILFGSIVLGVVLGTINLLRERFERLLYDLASHFEEIASWSFDTALMQQAYHDRNALQLQRIERTLLFMDIRGFTPWSEQHTPAEVVEMVNRFYRVSEPIIQQHNGFKIQMTSDEIMTRFTCAEDAVTAAQSLQSAVRGVLTPLGLSAGIGIHTGEVIEGLVGSEHTHQYGIFGDTVNTAARLQGQAQANEIVISVLTWERVQHKPPFATLAVIQRDLMLKGKAESMKAVVIPNHHGDQTP